MATHYGYLITRNDDPAQPEEQRILTRGVLTDYHSDGPAALAERLLTDHRAEHTYYDGPRRCAIWAQRNEDPLPRLAPDHAEQYDS